MVPRPGTEIDVIVPPQPAEIECVARHYDELDKVYRDVWGEHVHHGIWQTGKENVEHAVQNLSRIVADRAGIQAGSCVCDVGCGYGATSRLLATEYGALTTGLTVSESQFAFATEQSANLENPQFRLCPWEQNEFDSDSFDAVISIECISHIRDKPDFFRQIHRVLRPGGRSVVIAWLAAPNAGRLAVRHLLEPICREGRLPGMATVDEYKAMIEDAGLTLVDYENVSRRVRRTWWICARRLIWRLLTQRHYWSLLLDRDSSNRIFALTLFRILTAYHTGSMQYGIFQISKDAAAHSAADTSPANSEPQELVPA